MTNHEYSQGVCGDGAAILKDGQPMTIEQILDELRVGQAARAQGGEAVAKVTVSESPGGYCGAYVGIEWLNKNRVVEGDLLYRGTKASASVPEPTLGDACDVLAQESESYGQDDAEQMLESLRGYHTILKNKMATTPQPAGDECCCGETEEAWRLCPVHGPTPPAKGAER